MDRTYAQPLDVAALARIADTSEAHFSRTFRDTFGETPHRYLQRRRVERAMFLLCRTDRDGPSYTVDTLERLAHLDRKDELFLILGSDAIADLPRWKDPDRIARLATLVVAERPGAPDRVGDAPIVRFDAPRLDISSRELRARAARGRSLRYLVPEPVLQHIEARGLYRAEGPTSLTT